ncbi:hypothetical protein [Thiohalorhabdus denitrificans]|uniref:hypothetical protein n=1 Tax=Thiohalorhabdus denitrificans TaxID=381306 RepID=UPI00115F8890|nr:hypothetical protein [Thiohalorhabdus denitrificans]
MGLSEFSPLFWVVIGVGILVLIVIIQLSATNTFLAKLTVDTQRQEAEVDDLTDQVADVREEVHNWKRAWEEKHLPRTDIDDPNG